MTRVFVLEALLLILFILYLRLTWIKKQMLRQLKELAAQKGEVNRLLFRSIHDSILIEVQKTNANGRTLWVETHILVVSGNICVSIRINSQDSKNNLNVYLECKKRGPILSVYQNGFQVIYNWPIRMGIEDCIRIIQERIRLLR